MLTSKNFVVSEPSLLKWMQFAVFASVILYFGRDVFIPISFALLISFVLYPICVWLERKGFNRLIAIIAAILILVLFGLLIVALLVNQFMTFVSEWPVIQTKVTLALTKLSEWVVSLGFSKQDQNAVITRMSDQSGMLTLIRGMVTASASSFVLILLIPVYSILILYYRKYWMKVLARLFPSENRESLSEMVGLTINAYYNFIKGMAVVYLVVGTLNSVGLLLLGVPHAILFGFIASILTFVPYVGIIVGSLLPMAMAWITFDSIWYPIGIVGIFAFVQYLEANVIFPLAVSNKLNVNTLTMLVAIFAGGVLWGMAGMILFVPFVGIAKLIADHNTKWKTVSMILGNENE